MSLKVASVGVGHVDVRPDEGAGLSEPGLSKSVLSKSVMPGSGMPELVLSGSTAPAFDPMAPTVFHQPWWLDAVTGGDYAEAVVTQAGRRIGWFPYVMTPILPGHQVCGMPDLTHFLGPAIDDGTGAACNRVLRRAQITRELLAQVPRASGFWQVMHRCTNDTLVYQEMGYEAGVRFTFEVASARPETLWRNMRDKTRNVIRRAEEQHSVAELDIGAFAALYNDNLRRAGTRSHYAATLIGRVCQAAISRQQGRIIAAENAAGEPVAAIFYAWDAQAAYYLLSSRRPDAGNGAVSLLLWHAMRDIAARGLIFDFEGVVTAGSALFFAGFGGVITPRYVVSRFTLAHRIAGRLSNPFRRPTTDGFH